MVGERTLEGWALILGGSSGLGFATAKKLYRHGMNLVILHRDKRNDTATFHTEIQKLQKEGAKIITYNLDATRADKRDKVIRELLEKRVSINALIHSISRGNVKPLQDQESSLNEADFQSTMKAMGFSLIDWVQDLSKNKLFEKGARVIAFTSEGGRRPLKNYAAVSAAKASLEALIRSIAVEYSNVGIRANCIQAGVTDTPSLRLIPDSDQLILHAETRSILGRLTQPEDVADAVYLLCLPEGNWINGTIIKVDGGESLQ